MATTMFFAGILALAAAPMVEDEMEGADVKHLAATAPQALPLYERAETARRAGRLMEARTLYGQTVARAPMEAVPARGACRVALGLHRDAEARVTCQRAFMFGGTPEDMRNKAASLVAGQAAPAMEELVMASYLVDTAVQRAPHSPWGYIGRCDIARRVGDRDALDACRADLARVAPDHPEARVAMATAAAARMSPWIWLGRVLVAGALLGTLAHALARRRLRRRAAAAALAMALAICAPALAWGQAPEPTVEPKQMTAEQQLSEFRIDDANPMASVPSVAQQNARPLQFGYYLQDLIAKAEAATKRGDHNAAARFYLALAKAAPTRAVAFRRACESLQAAGALDAALASCRTAMAREGATVSDHARYVELMLAKQEPLTADDRKELDAALTHLSQQPEVGLAPQQLRCEVALKTHDMPGLETCTAALVTAAPSDAKTISFQWALAIERRDRKQALQLVERARAAGMSQDGLARMEHATSALGPAKYLRIVFWVLGVGLAIAILVVGARRNAAASAAAAKEDGSVKDSSAAARTASS